jgi:dephospho-CoA kinase
MTHTKNCKIIGLTGGIATGKTTVSKILTGNGYVVIDADILSRSVTKKGEPAFTQIVKEFGENILNEEGSIDRKVLGKIIFSDEKLKLRLNNITHPYIFEEIKKQIIKKCRENKIVFVDIPLLFEEYSKLNEANINFDEIWLVYVEKSSQLNRLMKRDELNIQEAGKRIGSQMPIEEKLKLADVIINNNEDKLILKANVLSALLELE